MTTRGGSRLLADLGKHTRALICRAQTITGVAPSSTLNTYGTATSIYPTRGYDGILDITHGAFTSGGTFGAETLTVRLRTDYADGTQNSITKTFVAAGGETALTNAELFGLRRDERMITRFLLDTQSTINNSTATAGIKCSYLNSESPY